jgi:hypothetical protein
MSPLAHTLLCAIRYAHGRSLHPYEEVVTAVRQVWPLLSTHDRKRWVDLVQDQIPKDLSRMIEAWSGSYLPVSRNELERELEAYQSLLRWCAERMDAPVVQLDPSPPV